MTSRNCPALLIAAPASGQGKTTVTAALARLHARQGKRVRCSSAGRTFSTPWFWPVPAADRSISSTCGWSARRSRDACSGKRRARQT